MIHFGEKATIKKVCCKMNEAKRKSIVIITLVLVSGFLLAGCVPKPYDLQSLSEYALNNREALETISEEAMKVLNDEAAIMYKDGEYICFIFGG